MFAPVERAGAPFHEDRGETMALCILSGAVSLRLALTAFTLAWTHSVERVPWEEDWRVTPAGLQLVEARVVGSGAGMEPPPEARHDNGVWRWNPAVPPVRELTLARSGATEAWRLCADGSCRGFDEMLGSATGAPVVLSACAPE
jgi:hypothetical protein